MPDNKNIKLEDKRILSVEIKHAPHTGNFFIDLSDAEGCLISVKISEGVAESVAKHLSLKITI